MAISIPIVTDRADTIDGKGTKNGHFTIQSAYNLQLENDNHVNGD